MKKKGKAPKGSVAKKGGKKGVPGKVLASKAAPAPSGPNPYDILHNGRPRHAVLNERVRGQKRNLIRSRTQEAKGRLQGLLKESLSLGRKSRFKDGRVGAELLAENGWSKQEVRSMQSFKMLRKNDTKRTFNLGGNQAVNLTHGGAPLSSLTEEELKGPVERDDDEDIDYGDWGAVGQKQKADRRREKMEHEEHLGHLDSDFADIMGELAFKPPKKLAPLGSDLVEPDGYDKLVSKLGMERKAIATERSKTPEEIAREQAERLGELERARVARASGMDAMLEVDDTPAAGGDSAEEESEAASGGEEDGEESESGEGDEEEEAGSGDEQDAEVEEDEEDDDDRAGEGCPDLMSAEEANAVNITSVGKDEKGVPMAPDCPVKLKAVEALLKGRSPQTSLKLVQRVRACTAVVLSADNRAKLKRFFLALLEYVLQVMVRDDGDLSTRGVAVAFALRKPLVEMVADNVQEAFAFFVERLESLAKTSLPKAADFCFLKLVALLFPVTDFQHPVCTPALLLASHWAGNLASLGSGISDLISEAMLLWEVLYEFCLPGKHFCTPFFQLGTALLESCWVSVGAGRVQCVGAAASAVQLLKHSLRQLQEEDPVVARIAACELVEPMLQRVASSALPASESERMAELAAELAQLCKELRGGGLTPLALFDMARPQIRVLDPVYHEVGDMPRKGMETSERTELQRKLVKERRSAARQLAKDAVVLQQLQSAKDTKSRVKRKGERKRNLAMMEEERETIKMLGTEDTFMMDTSLNSYSAKKAEKKANKRMGGGETAENRKEKKPTQVAQEEKAESKKRKKKPGKKTKKGKKGK